MPNITPQALGAIMSAGDIRVDSLSTKDRLLNLSFANTFKVAMTTDSVSANAQGSEAVSFAKPTAITCEIGVQLVNLDLLGFITGSVVGESLRQLTKDVKVKVTQADQQVTISGTPLNGQVSCYVLRPDGNTILKKLPTASYATGKVTLTGAVANDLVLIVFIEEKSARGFTIKGTPENSQFYKLDAIVKMKSWEDGVFNYMNLILNKVSVQNSVDIEFKADSPSDFTIKLKALVDGMGDMGQFIEIPTV